jgi:diguanylate cyclase (GGDEF)-like protein
VLGLRTLMPPPTPSALSLAVAGSVEPEQLGAAASDQAPTESVSHDEARAAAISGPPSPEAVAGLPEGPIGPEHDPATGLWSRAALERALAVAVREESWSYPGRVVMFVVFDDFNTIVDEHGREVGREVFAAAAQRLMACLRPGDIAVRHGIDGFVILLERNASMSTARPVAERVIMAMAFPFMVGDQFLAMGACVGLTVSNGDLTPDGLLLTGIGAASIAKRAGRGHIIQVT